MTLATEINKKSQAETELKKLEEDFARKKEEILRKKENSEKKISIFLDDKLDDDFAILQEVLKIRTTKTPINKNILSKYFTNLSEYLAREITEQSQNDKPLYSFPYHIEVQDNSYGGNNTQYLQKVQNGYSTNYHPNLFSISIRGSVSDEEAAAALRVISKIAQASPFDENGEKTEYFKNFEKCFNFSM